MEQPPFFRTDLAGQKVPVFWQEMHDVRRDILHYFENNLNEDMNVLVISEYSKLEYSKYLSVYFEEKSAESERYAWLCERGCLALLNGMSLDILNDQLWDGSELWQIGKDLAQSCLPYLQSYEPTDEAFEVGRGFLINALNFIADMNASDLDGNGYANFETKAQGAWFTRNIVGDYFRSTAKLDFG